jgi:hypothetical protein
MMPLAKTVPAIVLMFMHNNFLHFHCNKCAPDGRQAVHNGNDDTVTGYR